MNIPAISSHHKDKKQNKKIKKARKRAERAHDRINNIKEWNQSLSDWNTSQQSMIESVQSTVATIVAGVPTITSALTQLQAGLVALQQALEGPVQTAFKDVENALQAIDDALNDETTGLVGLNLARPQFGVFAGDGTFLGGTGPVNGSDPPFGPSGNAFRAAAGTYVVDFENDVSERVYTVTVAPTGGAPLAPSTVNCAAGAGNPSIAGACDAAAGAPGPHPNRVFVLLQNSTNAAPTDGTFTVTAFSG